MNAPALNAFLGRQPILDRQQQLWAYELLFRSGTQNVARFSDGRAATATVIRNLFSELSIRDVLGPYRGFVNLDDDLLHSDVLDMLPTDVIALEILETVKPDAEVVARCAELKKRGFMLALDDIAQLGSEYRALIPHVDLIKIDVKAVPADRLPPLVALVRKLGKRVLAEKVDNQAEMQLCMDLGCDYFQGYHFAKPVIIQGRKLDHSQVALLELINLLVTDADTALVEEVFKRQPGLTINLLRLTNSAASGLSVRITSLRHAITVLGRRQLQRWIQLLLYTAGSTRSLSPLLQLAATRGRLMELFAEKIQPAEGSLTDHAFMTGILSLTPTLLAQRIETITASLSLHREVVDALVQRKGRLGDLLSLTEALEEDPDTEFDRTVRIESLLQRLPGLRATDINPRLVRALAWANGIGREAGA